MFGFARWISAGAFSLATGIAAAGEPTSLAPVPIQPPTAAASPAPCDPCAPMCDPCCPPPAKVKKACAAPAKIIVHQADPIVEFRNDARPAAPKRTVIHDSAIRPVGDHGCECGSAGGGHFFKTKSKNYFQGIGGFGAAPAAAQPFTMAAMPVTVQAYVPQAVQTYSFAPAVASFGMMQPAVPFGAVAANPFAATGFNPAAAQEVLAARALAETISAALAANGDKPAVAPAPAAAGPQAASATDLAALAAKVEGIDNRLKSLERRLKRLCDDSP